VVEKMLTAHSEMRKAAREYQAALNPDAREEGVTE
jgi:hypothetical protein